MIPPMNVQGPCEYLLIRDGTILVRVPRNRGGTLEENQADLFDVRTGVQLPEIYPSFQSSELARGHPVSEQWAVSIVHIGAPLGADASFDLSKVVSILEVKQRRLDSVVADSILDQLRVISNLLHEFLEVADAAEREERFWMSQQILSLVRKFSGRELEQLQTLLEWLRTGRKK
jgi:hypothetical protein